MKQMLQKWKASPRHDLEAERTVGNIGFVQRVKRFISKRKVNGRHDPEGRARLVTAEDGTTRYGDDESSESDGDQHDGIPLVRRNRLT